MANIPTTHQAAAITGKGEPLTLITRPTPTPGPGEVLIQVRALAFNPVDVGQRDLGLFIQDFPAVSGSDVAGTIAATGPGVTTVQPGDRVVAFSSSFFARGNPDYGATQEYVLAMESVLTPLPASWGFVEGSVLPMATFVGWNAWAFAGVPRVLSAKPSGEGVLVWGAGSSMGAFGVQIAALMGYTVYATASGRHHEYIKGLGAARVFDYKSEDVLEQIVAKAKEDGLAIQKGFHAAGSKLTGAEGSQQLGVDVMAALKGGEGVSKYGIAPVVDQELTVPEGVETTFLTGPQDLQARNEWTKWVYGTWLKENIATEGRVVASPSIKVVEGGLAAADKAMNELKAGVSATKLVIEL